VANYKGEIYNLPFNMNTFNKLWGVITPQEAKAKIAELTAKLTTLTHEIERVKQDDTYQRLTEIDDWDAYFEIIKADLVEQVSQLEAEYQQILEAPPVK
jgi:UDP-galactopyranose mutase